ncbi:hypothetical protein GCM10011608_24890 [Micromonospora sonchi]|uniref:DUF397 domain-containing protein n=1 Tax=Micromonospora sonchi TaxID=1763543 RepID=A0A917TV88_9ACTN|nr:DUF397 domain-containing protein [Micromonospora sonchi]GGM39211.1 hypothetical protein GCM10011608_24890 [Micromonospora sonchi]
MTGRDLQNVTWRKSSRSSANGSDCVEVAEAVGGLAVRDSKDPAGAVLRFERDAWSAFVAGLRA